MNEISSPAPAPIVPRWLPFVGLVDASYWNTELLDDE